MCFIALRFLLESCSNVLLRANRLASNLLGVYKLVSKLKKKKLQIRNSVRHSNQTKPDTCAAKHSSYIIYLIVLCTGEKKQNKLT